MQYKTRKKPNPDRIPQPGPKKMENDRNRTSGKILDELLGIIGRLRSPGGCPWDRKQKKEDLLRYLQDEACEVVDAVRGGDPGGAREELGDLLFQILFLARLYEEENEFTLEDVLRGISEKMIRRHPHVFGDIRVDSAEEVRENWEAIKAREKKGKAPGFFDGIPRSLPALRRARAVTERASAVGFDWKDKGSVLEKVREELGELERAVASGSLSAEKEEIGDLLFSLVNLSRFLPADGEEALQEATDKFVRRFLQIEKTLNERGKDLRSSTLEEMDALWDRFKEEEGTRRK